MNIITKNKIIEIPPLNDLCISENGLWLFRTQNEKISFEKHCIMNIEYCFNCAIFDVLFVFLSVKTLIIVREKTVKVHKL